MSFSTGWWSDFFNGFVADAQRRMFPAAVTEADVRIAAELVGCKPPAKLLDVPCGTGRIAVELAALGFDVTGVELTAEYLADARTAAEARGVTLALRESDMRDLPWHDAFDAAICMGNSFSYFEPAGNAEFVRAVHRVLRPGGVFVLQTNFAAESILPNARGRSYFELGDMTFLHDPQYDPRRGVIETAYTMLSGGRRECRTATYQVYLVRELVALLETAGFGDVQTIGATADEPFRLACPTLHLRAVKR
jgi:SAM-dependent methyltransferase